MPEQSSDSPSPILEASKKVREFVRTLIQADDSRLMDGSIGYQTIETIVRDTLSIAWAESVSIAWAESVRDAWAKIIDANKGLLPAVEAAKKLMVEDSYINLNDPICMPPGMKPYICTVDGKEAVCLDFSMSCAVPLSSIYVDKVMKAMDEAERTLSKLPPKITNVYSFPNGMTMVFDQFGNQMPDYQGKTEEVMPKIKAAGFTGAPTQATWR
jgi:hypothetical protein